MGWMMTPEQFLVVLDIFQAHLKNVHHPEVVLVAVPGLALFAWLIYEVRLIRLGPWRRA